MSKFIVNAVVATAVLLAARAAGASLALSVIAAVVGALVVHVIRTFLLRAPPPAGAMVVVADDPAMLAAEAKARASLPRLHALFPANRRSTTVRFRFPSAGSEEEFVWGDLLELGREQARVRLRTLPQRSASAGGIMDISIDRIDDWQIALPDGTMLGGFTTQAMFEIHERRTGEPHPSARTQLPRFRDRLRPDVHFDASPAAKPASDTLNPG